MSRSALEREIAGWSLGSGCCKEGATAAGLCKASSEPLASLSETFKHHRMHFIIFSLCVTFGGQKLNKIKKYERIS